ncbi:AAA domain-containing protein [Mycena chlorophos]|uniref:AAA domain-containing protein n=1 Tax=Mycena chlorophos TaxID=658473 RepID=A0A8H6WHM6_MYCCL|nr:AAA domain-containing protein [Mycena chlorophos]
MPLTTSRGQKLLNYVSSAVSVLNEISASSDLPYLETIVGVTNFILESLKAAKAQSESNESLLEHIHAVLCAVARLSVTSGDSYVSPVVLGAVGRLSETLQRIATILEEQKGQGRLRRLLKSSENTASLGECKTSLKALLETFFVQLQLDAAQETTRLQEDAEERHSQLMELLAVERERSLNETSSLSRGASLRGSSSTSLLSFLPAAPKIFHGRDIELAHLLDTLTNDFARIAILGAGGIGKTTLVTAALHHDDVRQKYRERYFVGCEVASTPQALIAVIASNMGIKLAQQPLQAVLRQLAKGPPTLLVLDNLETPWEVPDSKNEVEEVLSKLSELSNLSLVVTMRGAERPAKVLWTRPHLPSLSPLSESAARDVFCDIADIPESTEDAESLEQILAIADNLPLALHLLANQVAVDGYGATLARWETEKTRVMSDGYDKRTSLEISLQISLSSPRLIALDGALRLLSLLSILPNGLSDSELANPTSVIPDPRACRTVLLQTALAYLDRGSVKVLAPVRSYIFATAPPTFEIIRPLHVYYCSLLGIWWEFQAQRDDLVDQRILNVLGNVSSVLTVALDALEPAGNPTQSGFELNATLRSAILLDSFMHELIHTSYKPWYRVAKYLDSDPQIRAAYVSHLVFWDGSRMAREEVDGLLAGMFEPSDQLADLQSQAELKLSLSVYLGRHTDQLQEAHKSIQEAMELARRAGNVSQQIRVCERLLGFANLNGRRQDSLAALQEVEALTGQLGQLSTAGRLMGLRASVYKGMGRLSLAISLGNEARRLYSACGAEQSSRMNTLLDLLADIYYRKTEYAEARAIHIDLIRRTSRDRSPLFFATANANIALVDILAQAPEDSILEHLAIAREVYAQRKFPWGLQLVDLRTADLHLRRGDRLAARELYQKLLDTPNLDKTMRGWCLSKFASPELRLDETASPIRWSAIYLAHVRRFDDTLKITDALRCFGDIFLMENDVETATTLFQLALDGFTRMDVHREKAVCLSRLATIWRDQGDVVKAREHWVQAKALYERSSQLEQADVVDGFLKALDR